MANKALSHEDGKERQPCTAVIGQFIDNEKDARHSPDIVAVPTQLNAHLPRIKSEGGPGHKPLLTSRKREDPSHPVPHGMALVAINKTFSKASI